MSHYLYLVRHGEQEHAEYGIEDGPLSERGRSQAHALGARLRHVPFHEAYTSPLERAIDTAGILDNYTQGPAIEPSNLLFDCIPSSQAGAPDVYDGFFSGITAEAIDAGEAQMHDAAETWLTRSSEDRHTLLVTHNFVVGELVRRALGMESWRWLTLGTGNCALTVLRVRTVRPNELVLFGDVSHLATHERTGRSWFPEI